jgi:hypothetical protein
LLGRRRPDVDDAEDDLPRHSGDLTGVPALSGRLDPDRRARAFVVRALVVAMILSGAAPASAQKPAPVAVPAPAPAPAPPPPPPAPAPAPAPVPAAAPVVTVVPAPPPVEPAPPPEPPPVVIAPVPTADATEAASDHDAVVGHVGIEVRRISAYPFGFALRPGTGCPASLSTNGSCEAPMAALSLRYWRTRNLALTGGLALGFGGGRDGSANGTMSRDTYAGIGPLVGMSLLLGNWRHLAVNASPDLTFVWFKPAVGDSGDSTKVVLLRAALEGELHFGFVGVPALSLGMVMGVDFHWVSDSTSRAWSAYVITPGSIWGVLTNLYIRYYL